MPRSQTIQIYLPAGDPRGMRLAGVEDPARPNAGRGEAAGGGGGADGEAKFWLTPTVYLADSDGFDARTLRELRDAVVVNKELIERIWNEHFA